MPTIKTYVLTASEVAFILHKNLGPQRAWPDWLADRARGRVAEFYGLTLDPVARVRYRGLKRPVYAATQVPEFVLEARRRSSPFPHVRGYIVEIDPADHRPWQLKTLVPAA